MKPPHPIHLTGRILSRMPLISPAERLDAAIEALLDARRRVRRGRDGSEGELVGTAALLQAALPPLPPGRIFEERLARRLAVPGLAQRLRERAAAAHPAPSVEQRHDGSDQAFGGRDQRHARQDPSGQAD
jgi:hypothetical protein